MNDLTVLIYLIFFVGLFGATFAFMWKMMTTTLDEFDKSRRKEIIHPEMRDVKSGESLLIFNPQREEDDDDDEGDVIIVRK
tara:strand:+ start:3797 stop:4039 length:243 start_codon:yes stop_codon:yes gene_type:complete